MSLWLIFVTLPASFFRMLRYVLPTSIWTIFMKNRIAKTEPNPNKEICDLDTVEGFCGSDSCNTSIITNRPHSEIPNLSWGTSVKNEKSNEDELYSESSIDKQNVSVFVDKTKELKSDDPNCVLAHQTLTNSLAEKKFTLIYKMTVNGHSSSILAKDKNNIYTLTSDEITKESGDDVTNVKFKESSDKFTSEEFGEKKAFTIIHKMGVSGHSSSILARYKNYIYSLSSDESSGDEITKESGDDVTNVKLDKESSDKFSNEELGDKISSEASGDDITGESSGDKITDECRDKITGEESGDGIADEDCGDEITGVASGDKFIEDSGDKITDEASGDVINGEASGDGITGEASGDGITERKYKGQTTDKMDKNDNGESNNKISDHKCYDKNLFHEECSNTSKLTILPEIRSKIDDCQPTFKRYFDNHNIMFLSHLHIPEDPFAEMYEDFLSPSNEMAPCEFSHEKNDNISAITRESSDDFIPNELKPDECDVNDSYKCSLDMIPMEFIYPCLPHSMTF